MGHYERLSALDAAFLSIETGSSHMHGGAVLIFDARPLRLPHGGIDIDRIREYIEASLQHVPRYLQRIDRVPVQRNPVWVDDERFNIRYHLRHSALPRPGTEQQLRELIGRIASQRLDRDRPLWEIWVIEGLEGDRLALVGKVHHCMMDGITGISVMQRLLRSDADDHAAEPPPSREPRTSPRPGELLGDELRRGADRLRALWRGLGRLRDEPESVINTLLAAASDAATALGTGLTPASPTPLNPHQIGSYRRVDWLRLDLQRTREIRAELGGTVNDVVLATLAGAVRSFFMQRGADVSTLDFRVLVPVNRRGRGGPTGALPARAASDAEDEALGSAPGSGAHQRPRQLVRPGARGPGDAAAQPFPPLQPGGDQRARSAGPALPARLPAGRALPRGPALLQPGPGDRALQLQRGTVLRAERGLGDAARPARRGGCDPGVVRGAAECGRRGSGG
jgi:WS/DGAT/MGAT family acyltransferase